MKAPGDASDFHLLRALVRHGLGEGVAEEELIEVISQRCIVKELAQAVLSDGIYDHLDAVDADLIQDARGRLSRSDAQAQDFQKEVRKRRKGLKQRSAEEAGRPRARRLSTQAG